MTPARFATRNALVFVLFGPWWMLFPWLAVAGLCILPFVWGVSYGWRQGQIDKEEADAFLKSYILDCVQHGDRRAVPGDPSYGLTAREWWDANKSCHANWLKKIPELASIIRERDFAL